MKRVACDTFPLLHLGEAGVRGLLSPAGEIHIPTAVDVEIRRCEADWHTHSPAWLHVTQLDPGPGIEARSWQQAGSLHYGEAQAIALARQLEADWLLTDDAAARLLAQSLGLKVQGSLGLVLWAAAMGHLSRHEPETPLEGAGNIGLVERHGVGESTCDGARSEEKRPSRVRRLPTAGMRQPALAIIRPALPRNPSRCA
jgi:predicted nucleic acid-binding protein